MMASHASFSSLAANTCAQSSNDVTGSRSLNLGQTQISTISTPLIISDESTRQADANSAQPRSYGRQYAQGRNQLSEVPHTSASSTPMNASHQNSGNPASSAPADSAASQPQESGAPSPSSSSHQHSQHHGRHQRSSLPAQAHSSSFPQRPHRHHPRHPHQHHHLHHHHQQQQQQPSTTTVTVATPHDATVTTSTAPAAPAPAPAPATSSPSSQPSSSSSSSSNARHHHSTSIVEENFKTEFCISFRNGGYCPYENNCKFAHSFEELRPRSFHGKYKTNLCTNYHITGHCQFGSRCTYLHDEFRILGASETWLVSPSENIVRVESGHHLATSTRQHPRHGTNRTLVPKVEVSTSPAPASAAVSVLGLPPNTVGAPGAMLAPASALPMLYSAGKIVLMQNPAAPAAGSSPPGTPADISAGTVVRAPASPPSSTTKPAVAQRAGPNNGFLPLLLSTSSPTGLSAQKQLKFNNPDGHHHHHHNNNHHNNHRNNHRNNHGNIKMASTAPPSTSSFSTSSAASSVAGSSLLSTSSASSSPAFSSMSVESPTSVVSEPSANAAPVTPFSAGAPLLATPPPAREVRQRARGSTVPHPNAVPNRPKQQQIHQQHSSTLATAAITDSTQKALPSTPTTNAPLRPTVAHAPAGHQQYYVPTYAMSLPALGISGPQLMYYGPNGAIAPATASTIPPVYYPAQQHHVHPAHPQAFHVPHLHGQTYVHAHGHVQPAYPHAATHGQILAPGLSHVPPTGSARGASGVAAVSPVTAQGPAAMMSSGKAGLHPYQPHHLHPRHHVNNTNNNNTSTAGEQNGAGPGLTHVPSSTSLKTSTSPSNSLSKVSSAPSSTRSLAADRGNGTSNAAPNNTNITLNTSTNTDSNNTADSGDANSNTGNNNHSSSIGTPASPSHASGSADDYAKDAGDSSSNNTADTSNGVMLVKAPSIVSLVA